VLARGGEPQSHPLSLAALAPPPARGTPGAPVSVTSPAAGLTELPQNPFK
jgi:hypothetical protein